MPQKGRDGDDWHDVRSRRRTAMRQEENDQNRQREEGCGSGRSC